MPAAIGLGLGHRWSARTCAPCSQQIQQPTLIVHGAQSQLYGDDTADHLVAALPHARAVRFERSGHAPHLEEPELFNATLKDFADRLSRVRTTQATEFDEETRHDPQAI